MYVVIGRNGIAFFRISPLFFFLFFYADALFTAPGTIKKTSGDDEKKEQLRGGKTASAILISVKREIGTVVGKKSFPHFLLAYVAVLGALNYDEATKHFRFPPDKKLRI